MNTPKRIRNERKFKNWEELPDGSRRYYYDVKGHVADFARYVKIVDTDEDTTFFEQEIYDAFGNLTETHEKFPNDSGHRKV